MDLTGKVCIITGGARGIGHACVRRFADDGAPVVVTDVIDDEGQQLASAIRDQGRAALFLHHDVSDEASWETVVAKTSAEFGAVHVLVNNAGIGTFDDVEQETVEGWNRLISINQTGVWLGMKHVGPSHARSWRRLDREHQLDLRRRRRVRRIDRLPRLEGSRPADDEERSAPLGNEGDPGELRASRIRRHPDDRTGKGQ